MSKVAFNKKMPVVATRCENRITDYIFILAISVLLILAPFYRGLFFRENYIPFAIVISCIFIIYMVYHLVWKRSTFLMTYLEIAVLLLPIAYVISFFVSVNMKSAFDAVLKYASYFMLFFMVSRLTEDKKRVSLFSTGILISLFLVSITGMLTMSGYLNMKGVTEYNRLYGLYQYPNATGSMLGVGILICVGTIRQFNKNIINILLQVLLSSIFMGFVMTLSLGSFLVFGLVALVYFIIVNNKSKLDQIFTYIITVLSSIPVLISYFSGTLNSAFILSYIISIILAAALQFGYSYLDKKYLRALSDRTRALIIISVILLIIAAVVAAFTINGIIPQSIIDRIWNEELKVGNANDRLIFTKDAIKIFKDNFLLGAGGGAWQDVYFKYQSFPYNSTEAHNFYVQLAIETGIIGLIILVGILFLVTKRFIKDLMSNREGVHIPIYFGIYMILGHAVLDFDLSLAAPMFLLWCLIGMVNGMNNGSEGKTIKSVYPAYGMVLIGVFVLYFGATSYMGLYNGNSAAKLVSNNDFDKAVPLYRKAMSQDRFSAAPRIDYAQLMYRKLLETQNKEYLDEMNDALEEIEKYEPYNWRYKPTMISLLVSSGKLDEGIKMADSMVKMKPLSEDVYMFKAQINLQVADYYYKNKMYDEAIGYLERAISVQEELQAASAKSIKPFVMSDQVKELVKQAQAAKDSIERSNIK